MGRAPRIGLAVFVSVLVSTAGCEPSAVSAPPSGTSSGAARCLSFPGESVNALRWNETGTSFAIASDDPTMVGEIVRTASYPDLEVREIARRPHIATLFGVTFGQVGPAWVEDGDEAAGIWAAGADGPALLISLSESIFGLHDTAEGFLGITGDPQHIVRVAEQDGSGHLVPYRRNK